MMASEAVPPTKEMVRSRLDWMFTTEDTESTEIHREEFGSLSSAHSVFFSFPTTRTVGDRDLGAGGAFRDRPGGHRLHCASTASITAERICHEPVD